MKMKKIIALLLTAVLAAGMLTGCSQAELTLLNAYTETASWKTTQQSGTVTIEVNAEKWAQMMNAFADSADNEYVAENFRNMSNAEFQTLKIDYTTEADTKAQRVCLDFDITLNNESYPLEVYFDRGNITVTKETFVSVMRLTEKYNGTGSEPYTYAEFLNTYAGDKNGVTFSSVNDGHYYVEQSNAALELSQTMTELVTEFFKTGFANYTSSLSSAEGDGVRFEFSYDAIIKECGNLIGYYIGHKSEIAAAWDKAVTAFSEIFRELSADHGADVAVAEDNQDFLPEMKAEEILPSAAALTEMLEWIQETIDENAALKEVMRNIKFTYTLTPGEKEEYNAEYDFVLPYQGANVITIHGSDTQNKIDKFEEKEYDSVTIEDFDAEYQEFLNRQYPVKKAKIMWRGWGDFANTSFFRQNLSYATDWAYGKYIEIDDRIYVPMRVLAEGLGYEVEWDNENERAYILDDENTIDMTGIVHEDKTYIKVRDFEKLGCTVYYEGEKDGWHTATVTKP